MTTAHPASPILLATFAALSLTTAGCMPTYAPPPRAAHNVAPDRLERGEAEVTVSANWYLRGTVAASFQVTDEVTLEGGGETGVGPWQLLSGGARLTLLDAHGGRGGSVDLEAGLSGGVGGERCTTDDGDLVNGCEGLDDGLSWSDRFAYGGYLGFGAGYRFRREIQLYARARIEVATATNIPTTTWGSALGGIELAFDPVLLHLAAGWGGYHNSRDHVTGPLVEIGFGFRFDLSS
ncbi:MAG: hypothetical protein IT379_24410 [Deltaproteobacteria bacterium]|nr:hypothetical protein [Deltaproteobacteria bacterium]